MASKDFACTATMPVIYSGGSGANPGDLHLPVGKWAPGAGTGWSTRALLKAPVSFSGMSSITSATLRAPVHTASGWHAQGAGNVNIGSRRKTSDWSEGGTPPGTGTGTDEVWGGTSGSLVSGGFTDDGDGNSVVGAEAADGVDAIIDITECVRAWFAGSPNYGLMLFAADSSTNPDDAAEFYSRRASGNAPLIRIVYETNQAPAAPTGLNPTGSELVHTGRTITYSGTRSDPDGGDTMSAYEIEVWNDGHTTKLSSYSSGTLSGSPTTFSRAITLPAGSNAGGPHYEWRARTRDADGLWGPWSGYQDFIPNSVPSTPAAPTVETDTLAPLITGTFSDPDPGAVASRAQVEVERSDTGTDYWLSGELTITASPWSTTYAGSVLAWGVTYRARVRVRDSLGAWSSWSSWRTFTPVQPVGPSNLTPRTTATKLNTLTPALTVGHSASFRNDEVEVYVGESLSSAKLWTAPTVADYTAVTTKVRVYAGTALTWGGVYWWRARVELADGTLTAWSALYPFRLNALPTAATIGVTATDGTPAALSGAGVMVTVDTTPVLVCPFTDPDRATDGDTPSAWSVEIRRKDTGAALAGYPVTASPGDSHQVATALATDVVYQARVGFRDDAGQPMGSYTYSAWVELKASAAPTITGYTPANLAVVTDQTPALGWTYASAAGKAQAAYRVRVFDAGPIAAPEPEVEVWDSGAIAGAAASLLVPAGILADDRGYRWEVTLADTDGLSVVLA